MKFVGANGGITVQDYGFAGIIASAIVTLSPGEVQGQVVPVFIDPRAAMHNILDSDITSSQVQESAVQAFVRAHSLMPELQDTIALIINSFELSEPLSLRVEKDADTGETWLEVVVRARGTSDDIMRGRRNYVRHVRRSATSQIQDHVRLFLTAAED